MKIYRISGGKRGVSLQKIALFARPQRAQLPIHGCMVRKARIEYDGATYHVIGHRGRREGRGHL